jgi:hypothetical protein
MHFPTSIKVADLSGLWRHLSTDGADIIKVAIHTWDGQELLDNLRGIAEFAESLGNGDLGHQIRFAFGMIMGRMDGL